MWKLVCLIVSIILFIVAALGIDSPRVSLGWLGLAFLAASFAPIG